MISKRFAAVMALTLAGLVSAQAASAFPVFWVECLYPPGTEPNHCKMRWLDVPDAW